MQKIRNNITKSYIIEKPLEESFSQLNRIVSTSYNNSKYSTFGKLVSENPIEFIFMTKWYSIWKPLLPEIFSTRISVRLFKIDDKSKITIKTKTNPMVMFYFLLFIGSLIKISVDSDWTIIQLLTFYLISTLILIILIWVVDRFIKSMLIERFERDLNAG